MSILSGDWKKITYLLKSDQCKYVFLYRWNESDKNVREPKFMVLYSCLMMLFSIFCFKCKGAKPTVESLKNGSMITVLQHCPNCGNNAFKWSSQPLMFGKYPAGNILSFGVLVAGASISKVLLVFKRIGMAAHDVRTFFRHQRDFILPSILKRWEESRNIVINQIKSVENVTWSGDGRFDSMVIVLNMVYIPCFAHRWIKLFTLS